MRRRDSSGTLKGDGLVIALNRSEPILSWRRWYFAAVRHKLPAVAVKKKVEKKPAKKVAKKSPAKGSSQKTPAKKAPAKKAPAKKAPAKRLQPKKLLLSLQ
jgi:hypothetical protein